MHVASWYHLFGCWGLQQPPIFLAQARSASHAHTGAERCIHKADVPPLSKHPRGCISSRDQLHHLSHLPGRIRDIGQLGASLQPRGYCLEHRLLGEAGCAAARQPGFPSHSSHAPLRSAVPRRTTVEVPPRAPPSRDRASAALFSLLNLCCEGNKNVLHRKSVQLHE